MGVYTSENKADASDGGILPMGSRADICIRHNINFVCDIRLTACYILLRNVIFSAKVIYSLRNVKDRLRL